MNPLILTSPAKLNLFLKILGRRPDGYHELQTLFQLLNYGDRLSFLPLDEPHIELTADLPGVSTEDNLIVRAARLLKTTCHHTGGASIHLDKYLPMGGGIGGGSSNAATTLLALNSLWNTGLTLDELARLGLQLGADVPVFVRGRTAWAEGVGEKLQAVETQENWYVVVIPAVSVSTAEIFSHQQLTRNSSPIKIAAFLEQGAGNDCESVVRRLYPEIDFALNWLSQFAPAQLTGTGACLFASFVDRDTAEQVCQQIPEPMRGFVAKGVNVSPVHRELGLL